MIKQELSELNDLQIKLRQFSNMLKHGKFQKWLESDASRFNWATGRIQKQLRDDLYRHIDYFRVAHHETRDIKSILLKFSKIAEELAEKLISDNQFKTTKKEAFFTFQKIEDHSQQIADFLIDLKSKLKIIKSIFYQDWVGFKSNISDLAFYAVARKTIAFTTNSPILEDVLSNVDENYLMSGWPGDLLVVDAIDFSKDKQFYCWLVNKERCATHFCRDKDYFDIVKDSVDVNQYHLITA